MSRPWRTASFVGLLSAALLLSACTGEDEPVFGVAEVTAGEVVQTVAAAAVLEPAGRVTVSAPAGGTLEELQVEDGDVVEAGDPLFTVVAPGLEQQLAQAESAVESAELLAGSAAGAGLDVAPLVGAVRAQLDAVVPPVIAALEDQVVALEAGIVAVTDATRESGEATAAALEELAEALGGELPEEVEFDPQLVAAPGAEAAVVDVDTSGLQSALDDARLQLHAAQADYRAASAQLAEVEADARSQAEGAAEAQSAVADLQREQAEQAVEAVRDRLDDLAVVAPAGGVVELRRDGGNGAGGLPGLGGGDLGALADQLGGGAGGLDAGALDGGDVPGLEDALGAGGGGGAEGPVTAGGEVGAGQAILTIFDLDTFTAEAEVDELDIVEVAVGQRVTVLLDAFPTAELEGVVERVALEPRQAGMGGALYPVSVRLTGGAEELDLRIGLTASVEIEVRSVDADLVVPSSALLRRGGDEIVHVVRDGRAERVEVEVLALGDGTAAIAGDLSLGDEVITTGVELVEDGQEVIIDEDVDDELDAAPASRARP